MGEQTIGRRVRPGLPRGDFHCHCDICGVLWYRSQLRRDGAGRLVCPDEGDGLDAVTLSRLDAEALRRYSDRRPRTKRDGRPQQPEGEFYTSPLSIVGETVGWWAPENGLRVLGSMAHWRNAAPRIGSGDLVGNGTVPTQIDNGLTFAGGTELRSADGALIRSAGEPTLWAVAALSEEVDTYQEIIAVKALGMGGAVLAGFSIGRYRTDVNSGSVYGWVQFAADDAGISVLAPRPLSPGGQHIYAFSITPTLITLTIDDDSYTAIPTYVGGLQIPCGVAIMGYQAYGNYHEAVVSR